MSNPDQLRRLRGLHALVVDALAVAERIEGGAAAAILGEDLRQAEIWTVHLLAIELGLTVSSPNAGRLPPGYTEMDQGPTHYSEEVTQPGQFLRPKVLCGAAPPNGPGTGWSATVARRRVTCPACLEVLKTMPEEPNEVTIEGTDTHPAASSEHSPLVDEPDPFPVEPAVMHDPDSETAPT